MKLNPLKKEKTLGAILGTFNKTLADLDALINRNRDQISANETTIFDLQAEAEATKLRGAAEATAIRARGEALRDNPSLVGLVQAERWDGKLPATMVPGSALPMLNLGK